MILLDTSVWVELLRGSAGEAIRALVRDRPDELATTGPVVMEVLAGSRQPDRHDQMLSALAQRRVDPDLDYRHAALIFRAVRAMGHSPRSLNDCLIAAVALRFGDEVVHREVDFERIALATGLRHRHL